MADDDGTIQFRFCVVKHDDVMVSGRFIDVRKSLQGAPSGRTVLGTFIHFVMLAPIFWFVVAVVRQLTGGYLRGL